MERLTNDTPQSNAEVLMNYAYAKEGRVVLRYGDQEDDIDLCEYMARMCRIKNCDPSAEEIMENGLECECSLSVLYSVAVQAAELRDRLAAYEDTGLEPSEVETMRENKADAELMLQELCKFCDYDRLSELAQADREGRCVVLPVKSGTKVFCIGYRLNGKHEIEERYFNLTYNRPEDFGKTIFLTREEAEAALEAQKGE